MAFIILVSQNKAQHVPMCDAVLQLPVCWTLYFGVRIFKSVVVDHGMSRCFHSQVSLAHSGRNGLEKVRQLTEGPLRVVPRIKQ